MKPIHISIQETKVEDSQLWIPQIHVNTAYAEKIVENLNMPILYQNATAH